MTLFNNLVKKFIQSYSGKLCLHDIVYEIRLRLLFNNIPSFEMMSQGEVDCAASAEVTKDILSALLPNFEFVVVALPTLPWLIESGFDDSRHCGVLCKQKNIPLRLIDPTPINGYGYGLISTSFSSSDHNKNGNTWYLVKKSHHLDHSFWKQYLYPSFIELNDVEMEKIVHINNARFLFHQKRDIELDVAEPSLHKGWRKEYWRIKAKDADRRGKIDLAREYYQKAFQVSSLNLYLLKDIIDFNEKTKRSDDNKELELDYQRIKKLLVDSHEEIESSWEKLSKDCFEKENWFDYFYYLGCAFWRRQSIALINQSKLESIPSTEISDISIPLYKLSQAWFARNNFGIAIVQCEECCELSIKAIIKIQYIETRKKMYKEFLNISIDGTTPYCVIIDNDFDASNLKTIKITFDPLLSHNLLMGLVFPALLII